MQINPAIRVISTGGTIDKVYDELKQQNVFQGETVVTDILREAANTTATTVVTIMHKDSLDMKEDDRVLIADTCADAAEDIIVVTHGTDTMVETAAVIAQRKLAKTIVLTGAMRPYSFGDSDAQANVSGALIGAQLAPHGVYICMSGQMFPWDNVRKNREHGWFEPIRENPA